jgi:hypothetical protein
MPTGTNASLENRGTTKTGVSDSAKMRYFPYLMCCAKVQQKCLAGVKGALADHALIISYIN